MHHCGLCHLVILQSSVYPTVILRGQAAFTLHMVLAGLSLCLFQCERHRTIPGNWASKLLQSAGAIKPRRQPADSRTLLAAYRWRFSELVAPAHCMMVINCAVSAVMMKHLLIYRKFLLTWLNKLESSPLQHTNLLLAHKLISQGLSYHSQLTSRYYKVHDQLVHFLPFDHRERPVLEQASWPATPPTRL